jgi:hypothetical protein
MYKKLIFALLLKENAFAKQELDLSKDTPRIQLILT